MNTEGYQFKSEPLRQTFAERLAPCLAETRAIGVARGMAAAVLIVLDARGLAVTDAVAGRIRAETDLQRLEDLVRAAVHCTEASELFGRIRLAPRYATEAAVDDRTSYKKRFEHGARVTLKTFREAMQVTQVNAAASSGIDQSEISRIERAPLDGRTLGVIRRLVEASGAKLEIVAVDEAGRRYILVDPEAG